MSCKKIDSEMHPDVSMIIPENDVITIETIRSTQEVISLKPYEGRRKVLIVDDADAMNIYAANAFLKTLEEPPDDSLIILISSNPERLPDTIRSRCINVRFYPLPFDGCREVISRNIDSKIIDFVLNLAMGRPGLALSRDFIKENEWFAKLLDNMIHGESKDSWSDKGEIRVWLDMVSILLRDMAVYKITKRESDLILGNRQWAIGNKQKIKDILNSYQDMQQVRGLLDFNLNKSITWNYVASIMRTLMANSS
jgi:DNA polymerase-3 subunit delta'